MSNQIAILVCLIMEHLRTVDSECEVIIQWAAEMLNLSLEYLFLF